MASKYLQKYPVPAGFQQILADFTREVLRDQPPNIIEYASKYFEMLEKGQKFEFNSKFNVGKEDKKYELSYNPKNAQQITKKASNIAARVDDSGKPIKPAPKQQAPKIEQKAQPAHSERSQQKVSASSQHDIQKVEASKKPPSVHDKVPKQVEIPKQLINEFNKAFDSIDVNRNGFIDSTEIRKAIKTIQQQAGINQQVQESQIAEFIELVDTNKDMKISRAQFIEFLSQLLAPFVSDFQAFQENNQHQHQHQHQSAQAQVGTEKTVNQQQVQNYMSGQDQRVMLEDLRQKCDQIFNQVDKDHSGYISSSEVMRAAQHLFGPTQVNQAEIAEFIRQVDENKDGKISRQQLFQFMVSFLNIDMGEEEQEGDVQGDGEEMFGGEDQDE